MVLHVDVHVGERWLTIAVEDAKVMQCDRMGKESESGDASEMESRDEHLDRGRGKDHSFWSSVQRLIKEFSPECYFSNVGSYLVWEKENLCSARAYGRDSIRLLRNVHIRSHRRY